MSKTEWKGGALLAPLPAVLVSSCLPAEEGKEPPRPNVCTVAWCGIVCTHPPRVYISLRPTRYSHEIISRTREFVINLVPASLVRTADSCGVYSGRGVDKFEKYHLTPELCFHVACPAVAESPLSLECRVYDILPQGSHDMFLADVVSADVSPELLDDKGALCLEKAGLSVFAHGRYYELGRNVGGFGFSVRRDRKKPDHSHRNGSKTAPGETGGAGERKNVRRKV